MVVPFSSQHNNYVSRSELVLQSSELLSWFVSKSFVWE